VNIHLLRPPIPRHLSAPGILRRMADKRGKKKGGKDASIQPVGKPVRAPKKPKKK